MTTESQCLIPVALSHTFEQLSDACPEMDIREIADLCIEYLQSWKAKWNGGEGVGRWKGIKVD